MLSSFYRLGELTAMLSAITAMLEINKRLVPTSGMLFCVMH